jgi:hypothetical protein
MEGARVQRVWTYGAAIFAIAQAASCSPFSHFCRMVASRMSSGVGSGRIEMIAWCEARRGVARSSAS